MRHLKRAVRERMLAASLTVEAALVLPLFLFFVLSVIFLTGLFRTESVTANAMMQGAMRIARDAYIGEAAGGGKVADVAESLTTAVSIRGILKAKAEGYIDSAGVVGGLNGVLYATDAFTDKDRIKVTGAYVYKLPFNILGFRDFVIKQKAAARKWTGYDIKEEGKDEETVYITKTGTVYHRTPNCTHIKLDIRAVSAEEALKARNNEGCKYYPCEVCVKKNKAAQTVFITGEGSCYHNSKECSGLKRSVMAVPLSRVGGRGPCSRCGGT